MEPSNGYMLKRAVRSIRSGIGAGLCARLALNTATFILIIHGFMNPAPAVAETPAVWRGEIDGIQTWVTVVPRGHEISNADRERGSWWQWGNVTTDAYLFAFERPDKIELIVSFDSKNGVTTAEFFLPANEGEGIKYSLERERINVRSLAGLPYLRVSSRDGPWQSNGKTNFNLDVEVDGATQLTPEARTDGSADLRIKSYGRTLGLPDFDTWQLINEAVSNGWSRIRFSLHVRIPEGPTFRPGSPVMPDFPIFALGKTIPQTEWFVRNLPPIYFDVSRRDLVINSVVGFEQGGVYKLTSLSRPPAVDFESPFVFYGFYPDSRSAQLVIRAHSYPQGDPFAWYVKGLSETSFRYSWKVNSESLWRYSLQLAGFHPYDQVHEYGEVTVNVPDYRELPTWVTTKEWPVLTFVESVYGYPGSEGIYFYGVQEEISWQWLAGLIDKPPDYFSSPVLPEDTELTALSAYELPAGYRGEYNTAYFRRPQLYLSPVDNRLHLLGAQGGVWNLGGGNVLRTHNLSGSPYIDGWTREQVPQPESGEGPLRALPGEVEEALFILQGQLLYDGSEGAVLGPSEVLPALLETSPPTDRATWEWFRDRMARYDGKERDPRSLSGWLPALTLRAAKVTGGHISEVSATLTGFRFVLTLEPGFRVDDPADQARWLSILPPGQYAVAQSRETGYTVKPLSPAVLVVTDLSADLSEATELVPVPIRATLENRGLRDAHAVEVRFLAGLDASTVASIFTRTVDIPAGNSLELSIEWTPSTAGDWIVRASAGTDGASSGQMAVSVAKAPSTNLESFLVARNLDNWQGGFIALLITAAALIAGAVGLLLWRELPPHRGVLLERRLTRPRNGSGSRRKEIDSA